MTVRRPRSLYRPCDLKSRAFSLQCLSALAITLGALPVMPAMATLPAMAASSPHEATKICVGPDVGRRDEAAGSDPCAWLVRARAELAAGRAPEAAAFARRAERAAAGRADADALTRAARLLRAEALVQGRRLREGAALLAAVVGDGIPSGLDTDAGPVLARAGQTALRARTALAP